MQKCSRMRIATRLAAKPDDRLRRYLLVRARSPQTCIGRNCALAEIDGPLLFLSRRASDYLIGQALMVDWGIAAK